MKQQHVAPRLVARALAVAAFALGAQFALAADVKVALSGDQEVPPVKTEAKGTGTIMVNDDKSVSGSITVSGLTPTAAHIHEAAAGKNGGVIIPLTKSGDGFAVPAGAKLTDAQYEAFKKGDLYVNVHTAANPGGEIRAQLKP
ncbi:MAG TPA: CHRD domain-containing protein [Casimicrobiaceae bacterium]|jgi:CHRD domain|nr:CHRD domain-containing protein [Casimicrobiaceae bacterium]